MRYRGEKMDVDALPFSSIVQDVLNVGRVPSLAVMAAAINTELRKSQRVTLASSLEPHPVDDPVRARYDRKADQPAKVWTTHGVESIEAGEEVLVPTYEIPVTLTVRRHELRQRGQFLIRGAIQKGVMEFRRHEQDRVFALYRDSVDKNVICDPGSKFSHAAIDAAFKLIEDKSIIPQYLFVNPNVYIDVFSHPQFERSSTELILVNKGIAGSLYSAEVVTTTCVPKTDMVLTGLPSEVGRMPIEGTVEDEPPVAKEGKIDLNFLAKSGCVLLNEDAVAIITKRLEEEPLVT